MNTPRPTDSEPKPLKDQIDEAHAIVRAMKPGATREVVVHIKGRTSESKVGGLIVREHWTTLYVNVIPGCMVRCYLSADGMSLEGGVLHVSVAAADLVVDLARVATNAVSQIASMTEAR